LTRLLLDTNVVWRLFYEVDKLRADALRILTRPDAELFYSPLSLAELSVKRLAGKFRFDEGELLTALDSNDVKELPVRSRHAVRTGRLPQLHKDPFDCLIIAQALEEGMPLVSSDAIFPKYGVKVIRA
jgi:PIN domain nuclease of toxin-antitoxin system